MNFFDIIILVLLLLGIVQGLWKGFEVELLKRKLEESEEENEILKKFLTFSKKIQK